MTTDYVHGYQETEAQRLRDQAQSLTDLLHGDIRYRAEAASSRRAAASARRP